MKTNQSCCIANYPKGWNYLLLNILLWPVRSDALLPCALSRFIFTITSEYKVAPVFTTVFISWICSLCSISDNTKIRIAEFISRLYFSFQALCQQNNLIVATHALKWSLLKWYGLYNWEQLLNHIHIDYFLYLLMCKWSINKNTPHE